MIVSAVILAAGRGERMATETPKAFLELSGRPLFLHAVDTFARVPRVEEIIVVAPQGVLETAREMAAARVVPEKLIAGGATRRQSSLAGLRAATGEIVLVHDGCRPFASTALIDRVLDAAIQHRAVVPVLPSVDTLYKLEATGQRVQELLDRATIARAQTPQGFDRSLILDCLQTAPASMTDDASAVLAQGREVFIVEGEATNLKVTYPEDLRWAGLFAAEATR